jgi:hypothetical protein
MRTVLSASLIALALLGAPTPAPASGTGHRDAETTPVPDGDPAPPAAEDEASAQGEANEPKDIMQNFTRHRPGACPEGPPCKVED